MGYAFMFGPCYACGRPFGFNPMRVPSIPVNGVNQAVCETCMDIANRRRIALGLAPHEILPGAYEPCEESELGE